jgi:anaphase-promoting complex subunit 1
MNALNALHEASLGLAHGQELDEQELEDRRKKKERREARELSRASSLVDKGEVEGCLATLVLALGCLMSGSCHEATINLLIKMQKRLHPKHCHRTEMGIGMGFGTRMAISMALGFVSLGGGKLSFGTESKESVAFLLISLYPILPSSTTDNRYHLQALRHFYVLAARERKLSSVDIDTGKQVKAGALILKSSNGATGNDPSEALRVTIPCLLPPSTCEGKMRVEEGEFWGLDVSLGDGWSNSKQIALKRRGDLPAIATGSMADLEKAQEAAAVMQAYCI